MVAEGVAPALIDNAASQLGFPLGPLQLVDETSIDLGAKIARRPRRRWATPIPDAEADDLMFWMEDQGRLGRKAKPAFTTMTKRANARAMGRHSATNTRWPRPARSDRSAAPPDVRAGSGGGARAGRRRAEDIREGDVGAILGWGFAPWSGGPFSWLDMIGAPYAAERCDQLTAMFGDRFECPDLLREMAVKGHSFYTRFGHMAEAA